MNALDGIRILDLSRVLAGPWCTQTLADLGADVIKIERPPAPAARCAAQPDGNGATTQPGSNGAAAQPGARTPHPGGDDTRGWGPPFLQDAAGRDTAESAYYLAANRNKRSVTCDIACPEGQQIIRALAAQCDVLVENFKVGDMARHGLDYATLAALNPRLVYCSITGFGQTGPYAHRAGYDYAIQAAGGLMSLTGERDDRPGGGPQKVGVAVADLFTGLYASTAILAALRHAERTGQGQHIDLALLDTQVAMLANMGANHLVSGQVPGRAGNAHANIVPYQVFEVAPPPPAAAPAPVSAPAAEHDAAPTPARAQHIILAAGNDSQFAKFCAVAGCPELAADPRFATNAARVRHRATLVPLLQTILKTRGKADWLAALDAAQVPCGAINNLADVFADPQVRHRQMVDTCAHPLHPALRLVASPLKLSATPVRTPAHDGLPPPLLGQHTDAVLRERLALAPHAIAALRQRGVV